MIWGDKMDKEKLKRSAESFVKNSEHNYIASETAISGTVAGMRIYDEPIFGFCSADDEFLVRLREPAAIGEHFQPPGGWLPEAKTVISFFLPFSEKVRKGNGSDMTWPSEEWLHGRIEGQAMLLKLCEQLKTELADAGYKSVVPAADARFWTKNFTSNWSERHIAFACGLGTFGLSKGLITRKGIAGRFGSIITELHLEPSRREYEDIYEYCSMCGKCAKNCPAGAITMESGKNHRICSDFLDITAEKFKPRYGCGKCQVRVPCESGIPKRK